MDLMTAIGFLPWSFATFPTAGMAWVLMWFSEKLYNYHIWWIGAILRVIILIMQIGILLAAIATIGLLAYIIGFVFHRAARGLKIEDPNQPLSVKGFMFFLLIPIAMVASEFIMYLFNKWLNFNEHGLGFIAFSYSTLGQVLDFGSIIVIFAWFVILPLFLHNRKKLLKIENLEIDSNDVAINCGNCFYQYHEKKGQGVITSKCSNCGRQAKILT